MLYQKKQHLVVYRMPSTGSSGGSVRHPPCLLDASVVHMLVEVVTSCIDSRCVMELEPLLVPQHAIMTFDVM